jgi:hypothetical protein
MNANPLNYVRGLVDALRGAVERGETKLKNELVKDLGAWLPLLRDFEPGGAHADLKAETVTAAEALLPKSATK